MKKRMIVCIFLFVFGLTVYSADASIDYVGIMKEHNLISHACGGYGKGGKKVKYTNSKEAVKNTKKLGYQLIEVDISTASDGVLVCTHDYQMASTLSSKSWLARKQKNCKRQTLEQFFKAVKKTDLLIVLDLKGVRQKDKYAKKYTRIVKLAKKVGGKKLVNRLVPQIYTMSQLKCIQKVYKWKCLIFSMYKYGALNYPMVESYIFKVAKYKNVKCITVPKEYLVYKMIYTIHSKNMLVYTHTVNTMKEVKHFERIGIDGFYTDYITPKKYAAYRAKKEAENTTEESTTKSTVTTADEVYDTQVIETVGTTEATNTTETMRY